MRILVSITLCLSISIGSCQHPKNHNLESQEIYLSSPSPYSIKGFENFWILPDSLSSNKSAGNAVIDLFLDNNGEIKGTNLKFLKIDSLRHFEYSDQPKEQDDYPDALRKYIPFLIDNLKSVIIVRNHDIELMPNTKYLISLPIELN